MAGPFNLNPLLPLRRPRLGSRLFLRRTGRIRRNPEANPVEPVVPGTRDKIVAPRGRTDPKREALRKELFKVDDEIKKLEKEAANKDRAGELLESAFMNSIVRVDLQINTQRNEITKRNRDKQQAKLDFEEDRLVFKKRLCATEVAAR